jgi:hypothetical protein
MISTAGAPLPIPIKAPTKAITPIATKPKLTMSSIQPAIAAAKTSIPTKTATKAITPIATKPKLTMSSIQAAIAAAKASIPTKTATTTKTMKVATTTKVTPTTTKATINKQALMAAFTAARASMPTKAEIIAQSATTTRVIPTTTQLETTGTTKTEQVTLADSTALFKEFDVDKSGKLNADKLSALLTKALKRFPAIRERLQVFESRREKARAKRITTMPSSLVGGATVDVDTTLASVADGTAQLTLQEFNTLLLSMVNTTTTEVLTTTQAPTTTEAPTTTSITGSTSTSISNIFMVAVGISGNPSAIVYSSDGINWIHTSSKNLFMHGWSVVYDNSMWIAGGDGGNRLVYSYDGINWTKCNYDTNIVISTPRKIIWNGTVWIASSLYSYDGINWNLSVSANTIFPRARFNALWNGSLCVGVGSDIIAYSSDGINWKPSNITTGEYYEIIWSGTIWVAGGGANATNGEAYTVYSNDGINWSPCKFTGSVKSGVTTLAYIGSLFLRGGHAPNISTTTSNTSSINSSYQIGYSYDGINWNSCVANPGSIGIVRTFASNGSMWVAGGQGNGGLIYSTDGINWNKANFKMPISQASTTTQLATTTTKAPIIGFGNCLKVIYNGSYWVAGGAVISTMGLAFKRILYSYDGINWDFTRSDIRTTPSDIAFTTVSQNTIIQPPTTIMPTNTEIMIVGGRRTRKYPYFKKKRSSRKKRYRVVHKLRTP